MTARLAGRRPTTKKRPVRLVGRGEREAVAVYNKHGILLIALDATSPLLPEMLLVADEMDLRVVRPTYEVIP